ncbi:MAG TPA: flagellar hook-associated protein FlgL, partial [Desulfuromonadaceae bacterium]
MRITQNMTASNALYNIQQGRAKLDRLQELTASGANINRPSDDPIGTRLLLDVGDQLKAGDQYASSIARSTTSLQMTSTALQGMSDTIHQATQLAASIVNGSTDPTVTQSVLSQLKALKQTMVDMGNIQSGDQFVFGGAKSSTAPFSGTAPYYSGDETALNVQIGQSTTQQMNVPGNQVLTADTATSQPYGSVNILKAFDDMITAVQANNVPNIQAVSQQLEAGADQIRNAQSDVASRLVRLNNSSTMNTNIQNTLQGIVGDTQNVDYAKLGVELTQQQTAFQASLSATAKVTQMSLL